LLARRIKIDIEDPPTGRATPPAGNPLHKYLVLGFEEEHAVHLSSDLGEALPEGNSLRNCAGEPVEDDPSIPGYPLNPVLHYLHNELVRDEVSAVHVSLDP